MKERVVGQKPFIYPGKRQQPHQVQHYKTAGDGRMAKACREVLVHVRPMRICKALTGEHTDSKSIGGIYPERRQENETGRQRQLLPVPQMQRHHRQ